MSISIHQKHRCAAESKSHFTRHSLHRFDQTITNPCKHSDCVVKFKDQNKKTTIHQLKTSSVKVEMEMNEKCIKQNDKI